MATLYRIEKFIDITKLARKVINSAINNGADWKDVFETVFSDDIHGAVARLEMQPEWFNPDMDYSDDATAYVEALEEKAERLQKILDAVEA